MVEYTNDNIDVLYVYILQGIQRTISHFPYLPYKSLESGLKV